VLTLSESHSVRESMQVGDEGLARVLILVFVFSRPRYKGEDEKLEN
jgi:hypothetical protein